MPKIQTNVNEIRLDIKAVENGVKLKYSNGFAEGIIIKINAIKKNYVRKKQF